MKRNSRLLSLFLVLILAFSLAGCAQSEEPEASMDLTEEPAAEEPAAEPAEPVEDFDLEAAVNDYFANLPSNNNKIGQADFVDLVKAGEEMTVLDIRQPDAYAEGHINGAVNIPWGAAIAEELSTIPNDKPVFVYCYSGQTAGQAVMTLNLAGFDARSVNLGWNFGISKVEGVEEVTVTEAATFSASTAIEPAVQEALTDYYNGLADVADTKWKNYKISEDNLEAMIEADEDFYLLSIRGEDVYKEGHIQGAERMSWGAGMQESFSMLPMDKKIVVYCYTGQTAGQTVAGLRLLGYDAVSLNGGMGMASNAPLGWSNQEKPVVSMDLSAKVNAYFANLPANNNKIGQADFVDLVKAGEEMTVIDIRQPDVYGEGHIKGAVNIPWGAAIAEQLSTIPNDKPVFVYCYSGQTAGQAVMTLNLAGFDARSVNLGWNLGISKVDGVADVTVTEASTFDATTEIDPSVQEALTAYYNGLADVKETQWKNYKVSEDNLEEMIADGEDFHLLSIRAASAYEEGHIEGADLISWGAGMQEQFGRLPMDKTIVVYCYTGQTAGQTVAGLRLLGYDAVSLNGGMGMEPNAPMGWSNQEKPVVTGTVVEQGVMNYFAKLPANNNKISQADFIEMVKNGEEMTIVDIRQPDAYAEGHANGAVNIPWGAAIAEQLSTIPNDKPVFVYCYSGQTAGQAVMTLNLAGFNARSVNLGWNFGISKAEGVEEITTTDVATFSASTPIEPSIQEALTAYYNGLADVADKKWKNYKVSEADLKANIEEGKDNYILSIRSAKDFAAGHIQGANNIPWGAGMEESFNTIPTDAKKVIVYCYTGQTAGQATAGLRLLGYDAVSLNGGMGMEANAPLGWSNQGEGYDVVQ
jgi:rhodanese-related sulfurtransferase